MVSVRGAEPVSPVVNPVSNREITVSVVAGTIDGEWGMEDHTNSEVIRWTQMLPTLKSLGSW